MTKKILLLLSILSSAFVLLILSNPGLMEIPALGPLLSPSQGFLQNGTQTENSNLWHLPRLEQPESASVVFDPYMIPHIYAGNDLDAYRLQGYVVASLRYWQMDFLTRVTAGRISEIIGPKALEFDKKQRRKGLALAAAKTVEKWQKFPGSYALLEAFTEGVNAYVHQQTPASIPIEYKILGYSPEEWTPFKTALFYKYMADVLCSRESDFENFNMRSALGEDTYDFLFGVKNKRSIPVIPKSFEVAPSEDMKSEVSFGTFLQRPYEQYPSGLGSNNWVLAPEKTISGKTLLANDPHLPLKLPSIWVLIHLITPTQNVMGVAFPPAPGIILGFNKDLAWGVTNVGHDVLDWMLIDWDRKKGTYRFDGMDKKVDWRIEKIPVKGMSTVRDSVAWTHLGPIWTLPTVQGDVDVVMRWLAHEEGVSDDLYTFPLINHSDDLKSFKEAMALFEAPAQNFVVATRQGDIAVQVQGRLPIRNKKNGMYISKVENWEDTWDTYIPQEEVPSDTGPDQGYFASANQVSTDSTYPYYYVDGDFRDERSRTINQVLRSKDQLDTRDMIDLQLNNFDIAAKELIEVAIPYIEGRDLVLEMSKWPCVFDANDTLAPFYDLWLKQLNASVYDEMIATHTDYRLPKTWRTIDLIRDTPDHVIFDKKGTKDIETAHDIIALSWEAALKEYNQLESKIWFKYRNTEIPHMLEALTPLGIQEVHCGGTGPAPNALRKSEGPSWRLVCTPGEDQALGIYPGGQSGHPGSSQYMNLFPKWEAGNYLELKLFDAPEEVQNILMTLKSK